MLHEPSSTGPCVPTSTPTKNAASVNERACKCFQESLRHDEMRLRHEMTICRSSDIHLSK